MMDRKVPAKEYHILKSKLQQLNMNYMKKKKEKEDSTGLHKSDSKEQLQDHSDTPNKKVVNRTKLKADDLDSRFLRARSSTCETIVKDDLIDLHPNEPRSRTLNIHEIGALKNCKDVGKHSPLTVRKFGRHLFEERRQSLPTSLPSSATNSPRFGRRNSDFISSQQAGLSTEDIRSLCGSLSELEKAKPRPKPYEEKPFYLCPENGSFKPNYWKSESVKLEKRIAEAQRRVSRVEEEKCEGERPLAEILPPVTLSSIYAQESNKAKRKEVGKKNERKNRGKKNVSTERLSADVSLLTKDLSDCRYLRVTKNV